MFDNLKSEINECKLKSVGRAETAEIYRRTFEQERAAREEADKKLIDLLHDVKGRYDQKLNSYMAKNKGSNNNNNKGKQQTASKSPEKKADDGGWGTTTNASTSNTTKKDDVWANDTNTKKDDDWGNDTNAINDDWGAGTATTPKKDNNKSSNDNNNGKDNSWGDGNTNTQTNEADDWGVEASNTNEDTNTNSNVQTDDWGHTVTSEEPKPAGGDDWGTPTATNINETNKKGDNNNKKADNNDTNNKSSGNNSKKNKKKNEDKSPPKNNNDNQSNNEPKKAEPAAAAGNKKEQEAKKNEPAPKEVSESKEFLEVKSQLWTAKLDMRLLERDKAKLEEEKAALKAERDDALKKVAYVNKELDQAKVRIRGVTVDLVAANEEIAKLNDRIDELESERRNKDKDVYLVESKRKSLESKYKTYQQQIADLQSEVSLLKEERDEHKKQSDELSRRNERLERDLIHTKNLVRTLKDGCALVEGQAKTFEVRHDTVLMTKADLERELVMIKEESSQHITTIQKLQQSNEHLSKAFVQHLEEHDKAKEAYERLIQEYNRKLDTCKYENVKLIEANGQLRKCIDYLQSKR